MTKIIPLPDNTYNDAVAAKPDTPRPAPAAMPDLLSAAAQEQALLNALTTTLPHNMLTDILLSAGYKATEENLAMLQILMENGIPLTEENISRMYQALRLTTPPDGAPDPERAIFLLQNNIRLSPANAAQLDALITGRAKIGEMLNNLINAIQRLDDPALARELVRILSGGSNEGSGANTAPPAAQTQGIGISASSASTVQVGITPDVPALPTAPAVTVSAQPAAPTIAASAMPAAADTTPPPSQLTNTVSTDMQSNVAQPTAAQPHTAQPNAAQPTIQPVVDGDTPAAPSPAANAPAAAQSITSSPAAISDAPAAALTTPTQNITPPPTPPLPTHLTLNIAESTTADIDRFVAHLREAIFHIRQLLTTNTASANTVAAPPSDAQPTTALPAATLSAASPTTTPAAASPASPATILQELTALSSHLEFVAEIRNQLYIQFPLYYNEHQTQAALHIYKDAKKQADGKKDTASALIAIDTSALGHFEAYVQKDNTAVHCQFRLDSAEIEQKVRDHVHELDTLLGQHGYSLSSFAFAAAGKPYTLLDSPALFDEGFHIEHPDNTLPRFDKRA